MHVLFPHPENEGVNPQSAERNQNENAIFTRRPSTTIHMAERPVFIQKIAIGDGGYERQDVRHNQIQPQHIIKKTESDKVDGRIADADDTKTDKAGL